MFELCDGVSLAAEPCQENVLLFDFGVVARDEHLYRHGAHRARLLRQVHCTHAAVSNDALKGTCAKRDTYQFFNVHRVIGPSNFFNIRVYTILIP